MSTNIIHLCMSTSASKIPFGMSTIVRKYRKCSSTSSPALGLLLSIIDSQNALRTQYKSIGGSYESMQLYARILAQIRTHYKVCS